MQKEGRLSLWHRTVQLPDVHRRGAHGHRRRYTRQRRTAGMRPCAESADRHRQLLKLVVQDVSCAESADRHRQLLKLAVQDVYVRQHARSAPTQISAQYTPNQAYAPTVYAHPRTDDQPRTPPTVCVCERGTRRRSAQCPMQQDVTGLGVFLPQVA